MSSKKAVSPNQAMEGGGFYNRHSALQASGISLLLPLWADAARTVAIGKEPLAIADYASSQGRNSMVPMRIAIGELRRRTTKDRPVEVIHTDLPSNDFSTLFIALESEPDSYLAGLTNVFPSAIGRSYFQQILAPNRIHLGWNTWSMQWMNASPATARDHVLAGMSEDPRVLQQVQEQLALDWRRYLEVRSIELRPGGKLLVAFTGRTQTETGWEQPLGELWQALLDMGREGLLSDTELQRITIPIGLRTIDDIRAPFLEAGSFGALRLEYCEVLKAPDPFWPEFQQSGDVEQLAQRRSESMRAWAGPTIMGLIDPIRDRTALMDDLFARFAGRMTRYPQRHEPYMLAVVLAKQS
jgi:hypothetical protein